MKNILVTGSAGFIGSNLVLRLFEGKEPVSLVGLDNMNNYYDLSLKDYRLGVIENKAKEHPEHNYQFVKGDLADKALIETLQEELLRAGVLPQDYDFEAHKQLMPMQPGDVPTTYADTTALEHDFGFTPKITLREGLRKFAEWYKEYYG